ncbi:MAG: hypothetical protein AAF589_02345 [Planctomycetota bacterium]
MRQIRDLPLAEGLSVDPSGSDWGFRQGLAAVAFLIALTLSGIGGYLWWSEPVLPTPAAIAERNLAVIATWTPKQSLDYWWGVFRPLSLSTLEHSPSEVEKAARSRVQLYRASRWTAFGVAVLMAVAGLAASLSRRPPA